MAKKVIQADEVYIEFECPNCTKNTDICSVSEVVYNGAPMCVDCDTEMDILEVYIDVML